MVAGDDVAVRETDRLRFIVDTNVADEAGAAGMEPTAGAWGVAGAWYVAFKDDPRSSGTRLEQPIGSGTRIVGAGT